MDKYEYSIVVRRLIFAIFITNCVMLYGQNPSLPPSPHLAVEGRDLIADSFSIRVDRNMIGEVDAIRSIKEFNIGLDSGVASIREIVTSLGSKAEHAKDEYKYHKVRLPESFTDELRELVSKKYLDVFDSVDDELTDEIRLLREGHVTYQLELEGKGYLSFKNYPMQNPLDQEFLRLIDSKMDMLLVADLLLEKKVETKYLEGDLLKPEELSVEALILSAPKYLNSRVAVFGRLEIDYIRNELPLVFVADNAKFPESENLPNYVSIIGWSPYVEEDDLRKYDGRLVKATGLFRIEEEFREMTLGSVTKIEVVD